MLLYFKQKKGLFERVKLLDKICFFSDYQYIHSMNLNILQLLEQLKKFMQQENGSRFSLILYILIWLLMGDRVIERLLKYGFDIKYAYVVWAGVLILMILMWFISREITVKKGKINIGIADLMIIHVNNMTPLTYEQKQQLSNETSQYLYNQIQGELYDGSWSKALNLIKLPNRIQVTFENDRKTAQTLNLDILVRWTLKFIDGKYFLDYKITLPKKIESWACNEIIQMINAYPDVEFDLHGKTTDIQAFIQQLLWIALLLSSLDSKNQQTSYLTEHSIIQSIIERIKSSSMRQWYSVSSLIGYLVHFVGMKNLMYAQERLDKNSYGTIMQTKRIQDNIQVYFQWAISSLKEYFLSMKRDITHTEEFQQEFLYALSNYPTYNWEDDMVLINQESPQSPWMKEILTWYFCSMQDNLIDAKLHYQSVITQDPNNMIALRSLWVVEYKMKNYQLSKQYLSEYRKNNKQHVFYPHYIDTKILHLLSKSSLHGGHIFDACRYYTRYLIASFTNRSAKKRYVIV